MIGEIVRDNFRDLAILGGLVAVYYGTTDAQAPSGFSLPEWWPLLGVIGLCAAIGVLFASGKIEDLFPEEHGIYLAVVNAKGDIFEIHELSDDQWENLEVVDPPLKPHPEALHRCYECYAYDDERGVAVSTWRKSLHGSEVVGHHTADQALDELKEVRNGLEPEARYGRVIRTQLPAIVRRIERQRAMDQNAALDPHLTPSFGEEHESMDDMIADVVPDEALPPRLSDDESDEDPRTPDDEVMFEVLDDVDEEALEPPENATNGHE